MTKEFIWGLGRRKSSVARVRIIKGEGKFIVNDKAVNEYFNIDRRIEEAKTALNVTETNKDYDVFVNVKGGGKTGQSGAVLMGVARALIKADPSLEATIRAHGLLTRDSRMVERKKYGLHKARRGCQFSKR